MTIIVGYRDGSETWLGADSRSTARDFCYPDTVKKLHRAGKWLIAMAGSAMLGELVAAADLAECETILEVRERLWTHVTAKMKPYKDEDGDFPGYRVDFIVGSAGELWAIACNGVLWRPNDGFCAAGAGENYAYGAAFAMMSAGRVPEPFDLVTESLLAACRYSTSCGGQIFVEKA